MEVCVLSYKCYISFLEGWIILQVMVNDLRRLPLKTLKKLACTRNSFTYLYLWFLHNRVIIINPEQSLSSPLCQHSTLVKNRAIKKWELYISTKDINYAFQLYFLNFPLLKYVDITFYYWLGKKCYLFKYKDYLSWKI